MLKWIVIVNGVEKKKTERFHAVSWLRNQEIFGSTHTVQHTKHISHEHIRNQENCCTIRTLYILTFISIL